MLPETVVCMKWKPPFKFRTTYTANHVNTLRSMVARHYPHPHRFVCITDDPKGLEPGIEVIPIWDDYAELPPPQGGYNPSCYRRLKLFSREMAALLGERFVSIDLDCTVLADLTPLWDRPEEFVIWRSALPRRSGCRSQSYNGSMFLMTAGARAAVWEQFKPSTSVKAAAKAGLVGSDQAWIEYCLGPDEATWLPRTDGVYSYRLHLMHLSGKLPPNARLVFFQGKAKPWHRGLSEHSPWIEDAYR